MKKHADTYDLLELIQADHKILREGIKHILGGRTRVAALRTGAPVFVELLKAQMRAEQETLYAAVKNNVTVRNATLKLEEEHAMLATLVSKLEGLDYQHRWSDEVQAKLQVLAGMVESHFDQEERRYFHAVRRILDPEELAQLGAKYHEKRRAYYKTPEELRRPEEDVESPGALLVWSSVKGGSNRHLL